MAYATLTDVQALNAARVYTATSIPNASQVGAWLDQTAAVLDSVLLEKGYSLPVPSTASSALLLLQNMNANGAWAKVEQGAEMTDPRQVEAAQNAWNSAIQMLRAQTTVLDIPKDETRASPRGPGVTIPNGVEDEPFDPYAAQLHTGRPGQSNRFSNRPLFTRNQQF